MSVCSRSVFVALVLSVLALACGGGGGDPGVLYRVSGTVDGLDAGTLVLRLDDKYDLTLDSGATSFAFSQGIAGGGVYAVTVVSKPDSETCTVENATGKVNGNVTVHVQCSHSAFHVSGTVYGLARPGLELLLNGESLPVGAAAGAFSFPSLLASGAGFAVTVSAQPSPQQCEVRRGTGTIGAGDVTNVVVTCGGCAPGFCWENPLPQGNGLTGVWGSGSDDVWAVGLAGTILHWDGQGWSLSYSPTTQGLNAVWGSGPDDAWAVGAAGTLLHWDGAVWSVAASFSSRNLRGLWGTAADDVWAVGDQGTVFHWDGSQWQDRSPSGVSTSPYINSTSTDLQGVWGASKDDVWAVGGGYVLRWNGASWSAPDLSGLADLPGTSENCLGGMKAVGGNGAGGVYLAGDGATVLLWNGTSFSLPYGSPSAGAPEGFTAVWGDGAGTWVIGWSYSAAIALRSPAGGGASNVSGNNALKAIWGSTANDVWAVGDGGELLHWDGNSWVTFTTGRHGNADSLVSLWGSSSSDIWASAASVNGKSMHFRGSWGEDGSFHGPVWGSSSNDVWAAYNDNTNFARWNGFSWGQVASNITTFSDPLKAIWGSWAKDVWAVGVNGTVDHWTGTTWTTGTAGTKWLYAIWGSSASDVWAVGQGGAIEYWNGSAWTNRTSSALTTSSLAGIWGSGAGDVWAVGTGGTVIHYQGGTWYSVASPATSALNGVWGSGANDVWVVGAGGAILHRAGGSWSTIPSGTANDLHAVWGSGAGDVRVGGDYGTVLTWKP